MKKNGNLRLFRSLAKSWPIDTCLYDNKCYQINMYTNNYGLSVNKHHFAQRYNQNCHNHIISVKVYNTTRNARLSGSFSYEHSAFHAQCSRCSLPSWPHPIGLDTFALYFSCPDGISLHALH